MVNEFYIQGISIEPEIAPSGWTEASLVEIEGLPGGTVQVDRFDCRLLLDPGDLSALLSQKSIEYDEEEITEDLDDVRYGDLYSDGESGHCQGTEFQYAYSPTIWMPPPPPLSPSIVSQILDPCDEFHIACCGPCSLRELAVIRGVAEAVVKKSGGSQNVEQRLCDVAKDNPGVEFLDKDHVHHCIFVDMLSQARKARNKKTGIHNEKAISSLDALREYTDDDVQKVPSKCLPLLHKILCGMFAKLQNRAGMKDILRNIEQGNTWLNSTTFTGFDSFIDNMRQMVKANALEQPLEEKIEGELHKDVGDDSGYPFEGDEMIHVDESTRASRLLKAQMMMKKRRVEHDEKSKVIRAQTVQEDNTMRQRQFAQITQHRTMFEDSDDD
jgi:hypothetical protein